MILKQVVQVMLLVSRKHKGSKKEKRSDFRTLFFWTVRLQPVPLRSKSRSRAAVARRAHNPKVGSSILPFATKGTAIVPVFYSLQVQTSAIEFDYLLNFFANGLGLHI